MYNTAYWGKTVKDPVFSSSKFYSIITEIRQPTHIIFEPQKELLGLATDGIVSSNTHNDSSLFPLVGTIPALYPEWLGDRIFQKIHKVRFSYIGDAMARGISSSDLVVGLAKCGMLGFFGAAGLQVQQIEHEIVKIKNALDPLGLNFGSNLIHSPNSPDLENEIVDLYLKYNVNRISAAAFMNISLPLVRYSCKGLHRDERGKIRRKNYIFAKISRPEVARHFLTPAPAEVISKLLSEGSITKQEADLSQHIPLAEDIITEADSGGHTDNRPLTVLFPRIAALRDELSEKYQYESAIRLGAAGGLGTPDAVAAAFALGAAFVSIGTVHQACIEAGISQEVKNLLASADIADVMMTPSADMFEIGVKVQVLKKGTMMGVRGNQLYEIYNRYNSIEEIPEKIRANIEKTIFNMPLESVWKITKEFFQVHEPQQLDKAQTNAKFKMALIFRWYLGNTSKWSITGESNRKLDYQIWCGPAIGSFNAWVKGTFLENPLNRRVQQVALNLLEGAAIITKAQQFRTYGIAVPYEVFRYKPVLLRIN